MVRARDLGLAFPGTPGPFNAMTDVPGVLVGMTTLLDERAEEAGCDHGPVRTGVTAILPRGYRQPLEGVWAGVCRFNGNGEMTGTHWIEDGGYLAGPIILTNTHAVGMAHYAAVRWMLARYPDDFEPVHHWALPVVAETYDGVLNDINYPAVTAEHVWAALNGAQAGPVPEGNVGGGTGMIAYGYKGGTGTASRQVTIAGHLYTVGVLVQANHGRWEWLEILGVRVASMAAPPPSVWLSPVERGSLIAVIATDAPLLPHQLRRLARRAVLGMGRQGTIGGNSSGDLFLAFSTAGTVPLPHRAAPTGTWTALHDTYCDALYEGVVQAVEEAILNALTQAKPMTTVKPRGYTVPAISHDLLKEIAVRARR
ncbi:MAG: P1 family peptidase [Firmicutes bacterium]|nr:P1 family peptidase [Bacillota bacterium]